jgi:hypothetical protein
MSIGKAVLAPSILSLLVFAASAAPAQNCGCVDATKAPYCVTADAQCWATANFYDNHIADSDPQARQKMLAAYNIDNSRVRSTYFTPQNQKFYKTLKTFAVLPDGTKSSLTAPALDCSISTTKAARCSPAKTSTYAVCIRNGKVTHLMSVQNPC